MAKQERKKPNVFDFHGLPIHYRIELRSEAQKPKALPSVASTGSCPTGNRKKIPTILLSIRNDEGIIYETIKRFPKESNGDINRALELLAPKFLKTYFDLGSKDGLDRRVKHAESDTLTFGVLWLVDMKVLQKKNNWKNATLKRYNKLMIPLLKNFHDLPFDRLTPVVCTPTLEKMSYDDHLLCANLIRKIFEIECAFGVYKDNPWSNYNPQSRRKKGKTTENLEQRELTTGQCQEIMARCSKGVANPGNGGVSLAAAFLLTLGISVKELCALSLSSIRFLQEPEGCLAIQINEERCRPEDSKQYKKSAILEGYRCRLLILPDVLSSLLRIHFSDLEVLTEQQPQRPLIHDPKNRLHFIRPDQLCSELQAIFGDICSPSGFSKKKMSVVDRLRKTAQNNLRRVGFTEEEMRYHFGWVPQTTAAKSYNDFACGSQLNRRRRMMNRWARQLCPLSAKDKKLLNPPAGTRAFYPDPGHLCMIQAEITLPKPLKSNGGNGVPKSQLLMVSVIGSFKNTRIDLLLPKQKGLIKNGNNGQCISE